MIPSTVRDIIVALSHKTRAGEANWQKRRFSGERDVYIELGPYVLDVFESRFGPIVVKLKNASDDEVLFSVPVERSDDDFPLLSDMLDRADPTSAELEGVLSDVRRMVQQAGPVG
jgi:hypothetical protein